MILWACREGTDTPSTTLSVLHIVMFTTNINYIYVNSGPNNEMWHYMAKWFHKTNSLMQTKKYMAKSLWTRELNTHVIFEYPILCILPFAVITTFTHLGKLSTRSWHDVEGIYPFNHKSISKVKDWCRARRPWL